MRSVPPCPLRKPRTACPQCKSGVPPYTGDWTFQRLTQCPGGTTSIRSLARSAWNSATQKNRPVGYGMIGRSESQRYFSSTCAPCFGFHIETSSLQLSNRCAPLRESDRTLRDGSFGWRCSRHFVPGYDRTVPPGRLLAGALRPQSQVSLSFRRKKRLLILTKS
jgi:hypothetical protein